MISSARHKRGRSCKRFIGGRDNSLRPFYAFPSFTSWCRRASQTLPSIFHPGQKGMPAVLDGSTGKTTAPLSNLAPFQAQALNEGLLAYWAYTGTAQKNRRQSAQMLVRLMGIKENIK